MHIYGDDDGGDDDDDDDEEEEKKEDDDVTSSLIHVSPRNFARGQSKNRLYKDKEASR